MIKTFKWIYKLGYNSARQEVFGILENAERFQDNQAQVKSYQNEFDLEEDYDKIPKLSPRDHEQRAKEIRDILTHLDPKRYPDLNSYLEQLR